MEIALIPLLALLHMAGALFGAVVTTYAELFYTKAAADGDVDKHERKYLRHLYRGITFGIIVVLIAGTALMTLEYLVPNAPQSVLTAPFWTIQVLTLLIIVMGYLISRKDTAWWLGSAIILTAWWMIFLIDIGTMNTFTYLEFFGTYIVATGIVAGILGYVRIYLAPQRLSNTQL